MFGVSSLALPVQYQAACMTAVAAQVTMTAAVLPTLQCLRPQLMMLFQKSDHIKDMHVHAHACACTNIVHKEESRLSADACLQRGDSDGCTMLGCRCVSM